MKINRYYFTYHIKNDDKLNLEYGVTNREQPEILYISCKTYLNLIKKDMDYCDEVDSVFKQLKRVTKDIIKNSQFEDKFIFTYDFSNDIQTGFKNKVLTFDLFIKQKDDNIIKPKELSNDIFNLVSSIKQPLQKLLHENNIEFSKTKCK